MFGAFSITYCCTGGICQNESLGAETNVDNSVKAVLLRSNKISTLNWRVCKQAAFQGWESVWGSEEEDVWYIRALRHHQARRGRWQAIAAMCHRAEDKGSAGAKMLVGWEVTRWRIQLPSASAKERQRLQPGPREERSHTDSQTPDTVVFVGAEHAAVPSSLSFEMCLPGSHSSRKDHCRLQRNSLEGAFEALEH